MAQTSTHLQFDLYIDTSFWRRVNITNASSEYAHEVVIVAANDFIWVCLVDIKAGTPFISALELRPLKSNLYQYAFQNQSNAILFRLNYGPTESVTIRYPDDPYDRIWPWYKYDTTILRSINTTSKITRYGSDNFEAPDSVLQTALSPVSSSNLTTVSYDAPSDNQNFPGYYTVLHITELQELSGNQSRQFDVYLNDWRWFSAARPTPYCKAWYLYDLGPQRYSQIVFTLVQLSNSTLPPILNGMEVYWPITMEVNQLTSASDVSSIMAVKDDYKIVRNWNGDPCSPANFSWNGVSCSTNEPPQITSLGGFGIVYHGYLDNRTEVAVKTCTLESSQANKQFLAEVRSLSLVHHKNLVTLVGYCKDGVNLAVVYEYLLRGSLFDHLRGKNSSFALNWKMRLNIVLDAAQALDYLHTGCGMVHRDVKSSNILLGQNFEAKVSDLGLARMFSADANSIITLSGTPGYMDPEYILIEIY
ncbi:Leucine-rich repeat protein kinase family protein [Rhynchospora pubera]|uniref:Leucine-rich repeat protein kinase family protein n=1 Tax=Rhynchospora pubera TaxID=906938 RepID=A0AAV8DWD0_9POAL|nr:Leucine-rich repeat protein kinase family protein [Rhynchospora pubera]